MSFMLPFMSFMLPIHVIHVAIHVIHVKIHVLGHQMCHRRRHFQESWVGGVGGVKKCFQGRRLTALLPTKGKKWHKKAYDKVTSFLGQLF
jgi:hypothetical protein